MTLSDSKNLVWHLTHPHTVYGRIAHGALQPESPSPETAVLGTITLHEHQQDAVLRVRAAIAAWGGALLADTVGLGKTYVALALAQQYEETHILAPAALLPMWRSAVQAAQATGTTLHSLHTLSLRSIPRPASRHALVVVDEAHHLRTRNTARYRNTMQFTAGHPVLLLSATPLHNHARELKNLLALFLGHRADALDAPTLEQCIIRRTAQGVGLSMLPSVQEHPPHAIPDNPPVLECILALPAPLPARRGTAAGALVRLGLLRAWCSSDAALTDTIHRRQLRGEALLHSLAHGRYPTLHELRGWIIGTDSVQLGFPELLVASSTGNTSGLLQTLLKHLDSLQALLQLHTRSSHADRERAAFLRSLLKESDASRCAPSFSANGSVAEPQSTARPVVAFSQFASTVRALHRALADLAGVASLTSQGGRIASGAIPRQELVALFAPHANGRPPPPPHERVRLLLTTDLLAEGVNLQDAGAIVHLDLPWTDALRQQRVGRLARLGAAFSTIDVHALAPPAGAERVLRIVAALERKAGLHKTWIGAPVVGEFAAPAAPGANTVNPQCTPPLSSAADDATRLRALLQSWTALPAVEPPGGNAPPVATGHGNALQHITPAVDSGISAAVAVVNASITGWVAVVKHEGATLVVAHHRAEPCVRAAASTHDDASGLSATGSEVATMLRVLNSILHDSASGFAVSAIGTTQADDLRPLVQWAVAGLDSWFNTRALQQLAGVRRHALAPLQRRALQLLSQRIAETPAPVRSALATLSSAAERHIVQTRGAGAELALEGWIAGCHRQPLAAWLATVPSADRNGVALVPTRPGPDGSAWELQALLLLRRLAPRLATGR